MDREPTGSVAEQDAFLRRVFQQLSQPVSALWCVLEIAAARPPTEEEDRQDLMAALALVEELGKKIRRLRAESEERFAEPLDITDPAKTDLTWP